MSRIGIKRYNIHRQNAGNATRRPGSVDFIQFWSQSTGQLLSEITVFELNQSDLIGAIKSSIPPPPPPGLPPPPNSDVSKYHFCITHLYIPPKFELVKKSVKAVQQQLSDREITDMINSTTPNLGGGYYDIMHSISEKEIIEHPCNKEMTIITGSKACAYAVYTAAARPQIGQDIVPIDPVHLVFYVRNVDVLVINTLKNAYEASDLLKWIEIYGEPSSWINLFVIPILLPNSSIIYQVIPDTMDDTITGKKRGRSFFRDEWLGKHTDDLWLGIDDGLVFYDPWETFITLDAKIKQPC